MYYAIIGDMVGSRTLPGRSMAQTSLRDTLAKVNDAFHADIAAKFTVTLGDEFQGLLHMGARTLSAVRMIEDAMEREGYACALASARAKLIRILTRSRPSERTVRHFTMRAKRWRRYAPSNPRTRRSSPPCVSEAACRMLLSRRSTPFCPCALSFATIGRRARRKLPKPWRSAATTRPGRRKNWALRNPACTRAWPIRDITPSRKPGQRRKTALPRI